MARSVRIEYPAAFHDVWGSDSNGSERSRSGWNDAGLPEVAAGEVARRRADGTLVGGAAKTAGLDEKDTRAFKGADPRKLVRAELLWKRMTVSREWLAEKLSMRSSLAGIRTAQQ